MPTTDECGLAQQLNILVVYKKNIALNLTLFMRQEIHYHTFPQHFTRILRFLNFRFVEEYLTGVAGNLFSQKSCTLHHLVFGLYVCMCVLFQISLQSFGYFLLSYPPLYQFFTVLNNLFPYHSQNYILDHCPIVFRQCSKIAGASIDVITDLDRNFHKYCCCW